MLKCVSHEFPTVNKAFKRPMLYLKLQGIRIRLGSEKITTPI